MTDCIDGDHIIGLIGQGEHLEACRLITILSEDNRIAHELLDDPRPRYEIRGRFLNGDHGGHDRWRSFSIAEINLIGFKYGVADEYGIYETEQTAHGVRELVTTEEYLNEAVIERERLEWDHD
jgi:hypothetical protein